MQSPRITDIAWGRMEVDGLGTAKDFKLWPGGGRAWDWRETGTQHRPGIQVADVEELINQGSELIVLSKGMWRMLGVCPETLQWLEKRGIAVERAESTKAVELYNQAIENGRRVGGLFHSTC